MTHPPRPIPRPGTLPGPAYPKPPAHIARFADAIGPRLTVRFLPRFGGADMTFSLRPTRRSALVQALGQEAAQALCDRADQLPRRVPIGNPWLTGALAAEGLPVAEIARTLRVSDTAVRNWLKPDPHRP
ncbi:MAG: helix-turn-helix domain-containing protein [Alkalilacustris sp.]